MTKNWNIAIYEMAKASVQKKYIIIFTVTDSTNPIEGASITMGEATNTTNSEGKCEFVTTDNEEVKFTVSKDNYETVSDTVTISDNLEIAVTLQCKKSSDEES